MTENHVEETNYAVVSFDHDGNNMMTEEETVWVSRESAESVFNTCCGLLNAVKNSPVSYVAIINAQGEEVKRS